MRHDKNLEVYKEDNDDEISSHKKQIILKIMEKYNISFEEAELLFNKLEDKIKNNPNISNSSKSNENLNYTSQKSFKKVDVVSKEDSQNFKVDSLLDKQKGPTKNNAEKENKPNISKTKNIKKQLNNVFFNHTKSKKISPDNNIISQKNLDDLNNGNVDSIMCEIIPGYNQQLAIEVNHVDLTFEVANEKIDTIKETVIRTIKRNKSKKFKIHALNDVSFKVFRGEKVGIIGYNGAGKSTLLNVISGIYTPDKGCVKTYGKISPLLALGAGFDTNQSGRKNIYLNGAVLGYDKKFIQSKVDEIIDFSELGEFIDIPIKNYSSGMLAKLGFSIATAVNPDILIVDEILGVGDVNFQKKSRDKIKSLMDDGSTVLYVSHSIPQVREICDKGVWIDNGTVREIGEVNKVCDLYLKDAEKASSKQKANIKFR